jgi:hypothetical protein
MPYGYGFFRNGLRYEIVLVATFDIILLYQWKTTLYSLIEKCC